MVKILHFGKSSGSYLHFLLLSTMCIVFTINPFNFFCPSYLLAHDEYLYKNADSFCCFTKKKPNKTPGEKLE